MESSAAAAEKTKVMVAIDDSDESFDALQWVLDNLLDKDANLQSNLLLTIIHVMEPFPHYVYPGVHAVFPTTSIIQSVNKAQQEDASAILTHAINMCTLRMVKADTSIVGGDPKEMICDMADKRAIYKEAHHGLLNDKEVQTEIFLTARSSHAPHMLQDSAKDENTPTVQFQPSTYNSYKIPD